MMGAFVFNFVSHLILPGTSIVFLILTGLILLIWTKKQRLAIWLLIVGVGTLYLFSISPVADLILWPLENGYQSPKLDRQADTIVMLTGGTECNILRAREVQRLYAERPDVNFTIIISGHDPLTGDDNQETSTAKVKQILLEGGINPANIIADDLSRTTFESARNVAKLIRQKPFFLITSGYHMPRSMLSFREFDTNPIAAPTDFKSAGHYGFLSLLPAPGNLEKVDLAVHEYFGIVYYKLKLAVAN